MKYRTRPADGVCSLEELFVNYLSLDVPVVPQTGSYSNKHTFNRLFFSQNVDQCSDIDTILSFSVFKDSDLGRLGEEASSAVNPIYYIIHPDENFLTGSKLSVWFSNLANKNFSGKEQPPAVRTLLHSIDYHKLCARIEIMTSHADMGGSITSSDVEAYVSRILSGDSALADYCRTFRCSENNEYLAVFLLYALFDDTNFDIYVTDYTESSADESAAGEHSHPLGNIHFQKLANDVRHLDRLRRFTVTLLIILNSAQMAVVILYIAAAGVNYPPRAYGSGI